MEEQKNNLEEQKNNSNVKIIVLVILAIAVIAGGVFAATKFMGSKPKENEEPKSSIPGYYSSDQKYNGGNSREDKNVNINQVSINNSGEDSKISINFSRGSKAAGVDTGKMNSVPEYSIFCLEEPNRIVVKVSSMTFWDYEDTFEGVNADGVVLDMFRPYTSTLNENDTQDVYLFFQLSSDLAYKVTENGDTLEIDVKKVGEQSQDKAWYVISSLYYDWEKMIDKVDLYPTFTSDYTKQILISKPFASESEANNFISQATPVLQSLNVSEALAVREMTKGSLPEYNEASDNTAFTQNHLVKVNNKEMTLPLLMSYGQYLCSTPDGKTMLFARDISFEVQGETRYYVELWTTEISGKATKLNIGEFPSIDKAAFSPDGKKLALLNNTSNYSLEVYDYTTNEIINLGEEGIGNMVANFAWDAQSNVMHVVAGDNNVFQMKTYDFSKEFGNRVNVLSDTPLERDAGFKYSNGQLYYAIQTITDKGYDGTIYKIDGNSGQTSQVGKGIAFEISPDGKFMAVKDITDSSQFGNEDDSMEFGEGGTVYGLKLIDLATGAETRIAENADIGNFVWSTDSTKLYYADNKILESPNEKYYYDLHSFTPADNKNDTIAKMKTDYFVPTRESNTLLVSDFVGEYYATYVMDINNISK